MSNPLPGNPQSEGIIDSVAKFTPLSTYFIVFFSPKLYKAEKLHDPEEYPDQEDLL